MSERIQKQSLPLPEAPAVLTDADGHIVHVTQQAAELFDQPASVLVGSWRCGRGRCCACGAGCGQGAVPELAA
ncbi:hypothetical protein R4I43_19320 [Saccharopolyspora sp. S2-29]|uniref:PAS domain-containing protein n=1 Tax=Saccharopolyspora mangrovi TaxID=3082379 RepID=A0ABU6ADC9_9PSEU|nr:hypothetical protein [Saccharopolyspora sp. S2-29]